MKIRESSRLMQLTLALCASALVASCGTAGKSQSSSAGAAPAAQSAAKSTAGMNAQGEVVDSKLVEAGSGKAVKGINDWEGEITGIPAPGSKFAQLQIGMSMRQVTDMIGQPSDQGGHVTGKAWIPWYFGSDKYRHEMVYKGMGRLLFASPSGFDFGSGNLIWIIHNKSEGAYR